MTEGQLIDGCRRGDASARSELYKLYCGTMYAVCRRYIADQAAAEDVLHDGFMTLFTKISEFRAEGSFEGWCRRIFVNTALGYLRKNKKMKNAEQIETVAALAENQPSAIDKISADDLMGCIAELPDGYRTILNLFAIEGYSHQEVAEMMKISENTSRSQYSRARVRLLEILRTKGLV